MDTRPGSHPGAHEGRLPSVSRGSARRPLLAELRRYQRLVFLSAVRRADAFLEKHMDVT